MAGKGPHMARYAAPARMAATGLPLILFVRPHSDIVDVRRNVYGSLHILHQDIDGRPRLEMRHGHTNHGQAYLDQTRAQPITYYYHGSGLHEAHEVMRQHRTETGLSMGVIGLGAGSMAEYVQEGDHMRVYELNPLVVTLAEEHFPFLKQSRVPVDIEVGDGLLLLQASDHTYDILTIDAFSGDAIPLNLMTVEAMQVYLAHLHPDGVLAFHITNWILPSRPYLVVQ